MDFINSRNVNPQVNYLENRLQLKGVSNLSVKSAINLPLNAPMINRIHKATPGCGSCGKKVV